jgi:aminomethyltransferase
MAMAKQTPLYEEHVKLGARMVDFGGWELPVQYSGIMDEHEACRKGAGLFDVSHMGEILIEGQASAEFLNFLITNDVSKVKSGQAQYTVLCQEDGGMVDDLVYYRLAEDRFLLVVNASNTEKDYAHILKIFERWKEQNPHLATGIQIKNQSHQYTQIAIQGRKAQEILQTLCPDVSLSEIGFYRFLQADLIQGLEKPIPTLIARTGYTGEDGFELYLPSEKGPEVWQKLLEHGAPHGLKPCGLGARDTLRLEMKYPLYGNELNENRNPFEAGLGWVVKLQKENFFGKESLLKIKEAGVSHQLVGLETKDRGIPRTDYPILDSDGQPLGVVTSGTQSPSLKKAIGVGYVRKEKSAIGTEIFLDVRGRKVAAVIVETPFYKRHY